MSDPDEILGEYGFGRAALGQTLPVIIFFAALVSILYYLGIMQFVVRWIGGALEKIIGISKVESLCAAANAASEAAFWLS